MKNVNLQRLPPSNTKKGWKPKLRWGIAVSFLKRDDVKVILTDDDEAAIQKEDQCRAELDAAVDQEIYKLDFTSDDDKEKISQLSKKFKLATIERKLVPLVKHLNAI